MMCISETYLDSSFPNDDLRFNLPVYNLVRANNPINNKRPNSYVYFKESLAVGLVTSPYLKEYTLLDVFTENRKGCAVHYTDRLAKLRTSLMITNLTLSSFSLISPLATLVFLNSR